MRAWFFCAMWLCSVLAHADDGAQPFVRGSMQHIVQAHQGTPFILSVWSLSCSPCRDELALLGRLVQRHPKLRLVLVSTDTLDERGEIAFVLKANRLQRVESWVFAESYAERLRYEIDREWYGELPRSYFYDAKGRTQALSGKLAENELEQWMRGHE